MQKHLATLFALVGAAACGDDGNAVQPDAPMQPQADAAVDTPPQVTCTPQAFRTDLTWYGTNRADLTTWLASKGCTSAGYDATKKPVALFDWDNTISKNDFGDAFTFYLVAHDKILQPPSQDWTQTSPYLTSAAVTALSTACGTTVLAGQPLPTSTNNACADQILNIYISGTVDGTSTGVAAWGNGFNPRQIEPAYAWTAQLAAGYTHAEVEAIATAAITPQLTAAETATQTIGTHAGLNGWLRIYDQTKDVIAVAQSQGYDVWIITASPQDVIKAFSSQAGVAPDHVIGIRSKTDSANKLTYKFEGCGNVADDNQSLISYIQGKRCWVNKVVFGETTNAMQRRPDGQRQVFAAGDSDTDIEFLRDATYRLVINRNKTELMCHAYNNTGDGWRVNPMFIGPKSAKSSAYTCSTSCMNGMGTIPCLDDSNGVIANQADTVHP
ncbi:MAG TPA: haloacid dehalogenase-like hydrolase [Kofleriaceae bacterium]|jgi:phosphoserine phosphatase|nr:haloacid dehalogenase-like hydrolase [Kofleriaceae bacterium]